MRFLSLAGAWWLFVPDSPSGIFRRHSELGNDMAKFPDYNYIEVAIGGLHNRNQIVKTSEMPNISGREDYRSMFRFTEDIKTYTQKHLINEKPSVSGYQGICYTDYLWFDIDCIDANNKPDLPKAFDDITYLINRLRDVYEVDPSILRVYFTGSKGFCIGIPSDIFSLEPSEHLPDICRQLAKEIAGDIGIDESIYETVRLWRLSNSINAKSGLYKIEIEPGADILMGSIDDILEMAKSKRADKIEHPELDENYIGMLAYLVKDVETKHPEEQRGSKSSGDRWIVDALDGISEGDRNNTLFNLAGVFLGKHPQDIAWKVLSIVNDRCNPPLDERELQTLFQSSLKKKANSGEAEPDKEQGSSRTLTDMRQNPPQKKPCLIGGGVLPAYGYTMLGGQTKEGKSTLVMQLCLSILSGTPFLNQFTIEAKDTQILYINLELDDSIIFNMVESQIEHFDVDFSDKLDNFHLWTLKGFSLNEAKDRDMLRAEILAKHINLVVIDPVSLAMGFDQNKYEVVKAFVKKLETISADVGGVAWLLIHHFSKPQDAQKETIHKLIGSSAWGNFAESVMGIERYSQTRSADYKSLNFKLRSDRTPNDITLYHNPETRLFEVVKDVEDIPAIKTERIVGILQGAGKPLRYGELVKLIEVELRLSTQHAKLMISKTVDDKLIVKENKLYMVENKTKRL